MLCSFFWVIPLRLNFMCRRIGALCPIFIGGVSPHHLWRWNWQCSETSAHKIQTPAHHPKERIHDHVSYTPRTCNFGLKNGWNTLPCEWMQKIPSKRHLPATLRGAGVCKFQFYMNGSCLWRAGVSDTLSASSSYAARPVFLQSQILPGSLSKNFFFNFKVFISTDLKAEIGLLLLDGNVRCTSEEW